MRSLLKVVPLLLSSAALAAPDTGYDLRANTPLAHVVRGGVVADAAAPGFVKYTRDKSGRWKLGVTEKGRPAALQPGLQANLWLPVDAELAGQALVLEAAFSPTGTKLALDAFVNGKKVGSPSISAGWQNKRIEIPAGVVKAGINKVRLHFREQVEHGGTRTAAAIRFVRITRASAPAAPTDEADVAAALRAYEGDSLVLPDGAGLDYYLTPVKGLRLTGAARGGTAEVWVQLDGKSPTKLGAGDKLDVSLDPVADHAVRLMLRGKGGVVKLDGARIGGAAKAPVNKVARPKYVVFWLIDTLRADKLSFYSHPNPHERKVKTPNLDALAKESTVFEPFWVQGNESKASHASLFTGTFPLAHGVYTHEASLAASHTTLAEAFKAAGYQTAGFVSNGYVSEKWNFAQGFDLFVNFIRDGKPNNAKAVLKKALPWIDAHKATPFYLYLGTSDPHVTYRAHKEFIGTYDKGHKSYAGKYVKHLSGGELGKIKTRKSPPSERDRSRIEALYENEVAFNDKHFGALVAHLKTAGLYDDTMIIVSADHGDEFWEHGGCGHGHSLHQELINVPLVVKWPAAFPARKVTVGADGVDLLPTLLHVLAQPVPKDVQGHDLLPFVHAKGAVYPRAVMASQGRGAFALQAGRAKVIFRSEASIQVYDVKEDPAELADVMGKRPVLTLAALDPLSLYLSRGKTWRKRSFGAPNNLSRGFK